MTIDDAVSIPTNRVSRRRLRFRFGLRGLIVLVTLAAIVFAPLGNFVRRSQRQRKAISDLTALGAVVILRGTRGPVSFRSGPWRVQFGPRTVSEARRYPMPPLQFNPPYASELTDQQMAAVADALTRLDQIQFVGIESSSLTDDGLMMLTRLKHLDSLDLRCPLVTSRGTDTLQQRFPKLNIHDD